MGADPAATRGRRRIASCPVPETSDNTATEPTPAASSSPVPTAASAGPSPSGSSPPATRSPRSTAPATCPPACSAWSATCATPRASTRRSPQIEAAHGPVEVLVANAGVTRDQLLMRMTDEEFDRRPRRQPHRRVPLRAPREQGHDPPAPRPHHPHLLGRRRCTARPGQVNYAASKSALVGMARSITRELGGRGDHRERRRPGLHRHRHDRARCPRSAQEAYRDVDPAGPVRPGRRGRRRRGVPRLADAAAYISGAVIPVDGGLGMGH